ncbi:MAG: TIGR03936 family radical SAM-associated protein [Acetivibrionales bacterium]|jgi:radical SAM-linked protein
MAKTLRFRFSRGQELKYIAHLDILRVFERAIKRAKIPVAFTQGFNPRQKLVFGLPMSIGLTSDSEYADIELAKDMEPEDFINQINQGLPEGIKVEEAVSRITRDNIMNQITAARYEIMFGLNEPRSHSEIETMVHELLSKEEVSVIKKSKKGPRPVNIRPLIYSLAVKQIDTDKFRLDAFLSAGAENNLRADLLMKAFGEETKLEIDNISMHRKALYASTFNEWKNPFEVAND